MSLTKLSLFPTTPEDLDIILAMETSPENATYIFQWKRNQHAAAISDTNIAHLKIVLGNKIVGYLILIGLTNPDQSINFRRIVIEEKGYGYGRQAIGLVKDMVFNKFKAHRLWLDVMAHNERAYALYLSEGFIFEGVLRESYKQEGRFIDLKIMSILEQEYKQDLSKNQTKN